MERSKSFSLSTSISKEPLNRMGKILSSWRSKRVTPKSCSYDNDLYSLMLWWSYDCYWHYLVSSSESSVSQRYHINTRFPGAERVVISSLTVSDVTAAPGHIMAVQPCTSRELLITQWFWAWHHFFLLQGRMSLMSKMMRCASLGEQQQVFKIFL